MGSRFVGVRFANGAAFAVRSDCERRPPWLEAEVSATGHWPPWHLAVAEAIRATRRWEGAGPVGVRAWRVDDGRLVAVIEDVAWRQPMRARCSNSGKHAAPDPECWCGCYAVRPEAGAQVFSRWPLRVAAVGVVSLYGRVMRHRYGWRAEYVRIREVWWFSGPGRPAPRTDLYPGVTWHRVEVEW